MEQQELLNLTIDMLFEKEHQDAIKKGIAIFKKVQEKLYELAEKDDEKTLAGIKAGTIILLTVLKKMAQGTAPDKFKDEDYADIAKAVSEYVVLMDDQEYSAFVFDLYAGYIDASVKVLSMRVDKKRAESILTLSKELRKKSAMLRDGKISETVYIEDCLWISLEAMIKLLSAYAGSLVGQEYIDLAQAVSMCAIEYGRLMLYKREQAILGEYIEKQYQLDEELTEKFGAFKAELKTDSDRFNELVGQAFEPGFRESLKSSVELAKAAGVKQEEILDSVEKIGSFFMD